MNFLQELNNFIYNHPVTSKQPHKIVRRISGHPVCVQWSEIFSEMAFIFQKILP